MVKIVNNRKNTDDLLTILLPLKGRPEFTLRLLDHMQRIQFPFQLLIADGSLDDSMVDVLGNRNIFKKVNYKYFRYPYDATLSDFYRKMVSVCEKIMTPYVAMMDNDTFFSVEGLIASLHYLETNREYSTCRGQHVDFNLFGENETDVCLYDGRRMMINEVYFDKKDSIWRSFEQDNALDRLDSWSDCTNIIFYNIHRTSCIREVWRFLLDKDIMDLFMVDLTLSLLAIALGKTKVLDLPYMLRQSNSPINVSRDAIKAKNIFERLFVEKWMHDFGRIVEAITDVVCRKSGDRHDEASSRISHALMNHFADRIYLHLQKREKNKPIKDKVVDPASYKVLEIKNPADLTGELSLAASYMMQPQPKELELALSTKGPVKQSGNKR